MLIALAALALMQETVPTALSDLPPPPPAASAMPPTPTPSVPPGDLSTSPPLPQGPLLPVARSETGETFLVVDRAAKAGDIADFWTFEVFSPAIEIRPGVAAVQGIAHHEVNCDAKTDQTVASAGYDESGTPVVALAASPAAPLVAASANGLIADAICRGAPWPKSGELQGHAAALAQARTPAGS